MPRILVVAAFKFAVDGNHVIEVEPGEQDVSERCAEVAVEHLKVATRVKGGPPAVVAPVATPDLTAGAVSTAAPPAAPAQSVVKPAAKPVVKPGAKPKAKPAPKPKANAGGA
jgi:hypothetical protein